MSTAIVRLRIGIGALTLGGAVCAWLGGLDAVLGFCAGVGVTALLAWRREPVSRKVVVVRRAKSRPEATASVSSTEVDHATSPIEAPEPTPIHR